MELDKAIKLFEENKYIESFELANKTEWLLHKFTLEGWLYYASRIVTNKRKAA